MNNPQQLLERLEAIGQSLAQTGQALALIGLGSVGIERDRLDRYSDLDFFAIVRRGQKAHFLEDLTWLRSVAPVDYCFRNTADGYKLLYSDGIFCECAVFEPEELSAIPFAEGRIVWKEPEVPESIARPAAIPRARAAQPEEWLLGEALTCLYVGLSRYRRGEKLSAQRFIQHYAADRLLELAERVESASAGLPDRFSVERRFEQRFPVLSEKLPAFIQGYERIPESALALLDYLDQHFEVNQAIRQRIIELAVPEM